MMVEIVEMALIPYYCCLLRVGTIFLGCLTTRGEPFSSENYRFQDNFLSSPSHAWNMRGPCTFAFGRSVFFGVHTSGFSADAQCYISPPNTYFIAKAYNYKTILLYSTYFLLIPQTIDDVEHSIRWSVF